MITVILLIRTSTDIVPKDQLSYINCDIKFVVNNAKHNTDHNYSYKIKKTLNTYQNPRKYENKN